MKTERIAAASLLLALGAALSPPAAAEDVAVQTNTGGIPVPAGAADVEFISKTIATTGPRMLLIHYSAECQVIRGHVEYDIVVSRDFLALTARQAAPTNGTLSALCSNDGATTESNLRAATVGTVVACTVDAGANYTVRVRGHVEGPGSVGAGMVDDQSLVIEERVFSPGVPACVNPLLQQQ